MQAIVHDSYGSVEVLERAELEPPAIGDDEVLIRVHAAGVDRGVWHLMAGLPYLVRILGFGLLRPKTRIPGFDIAGRVEEVGSRVADLRPGDPVLGTCTGAFAELAAAKATALVGMPESLSFEQAAALPTSAMTALQALRDGGRVEPGQRVLILGASGGVGTYAVQLATAVFDAHVTGVCSAAKADLVRSLGADEVIDYVREDATDGRRRYDVILDIGGLRPLAHLRRALTDTGTLVIVGGEGGGRWLGGVGRQLRAALPSPFVRHRLRPFFSVPRREDLQQLANLSRDGLIRPVVDRSFPLAEAAAAIRYLEAGRARGKVVLTV